MIDELAVRRFELEIPIAASPSRVWQSLVTEIDTWWLPDFHELGPESSVRLDPVPGGALRETTTDGAGLLWYTVQMVVPEKSLHLLGHIAPAWGGPSVSMLQVELEEDEDGCRVKVSDALLGRVDEAGAEQLSEGWRSLFESLKEHVEGGD